MDWDKFPSEKIKFQHDFAAEKLVGGETITSQTVTASEGVTVEDVSEADGFVSVEISGGTSGQYYTVTCLVETDQGHRYVDVAVLYIK